MKKGNIIQGYRILEDFRVVGGMSKVSFAERGGKEFFIKEFLSPKFPTPDSPGSEKTKARKRKECDDFENHHRRINNLIKDRCAGLGGGLVYAIDFFRDGASYYKVNEKIDTSSLSLKEISSLPAESIITIARSVCQSVSILHDVKIVHGDLKPDNILIKETSRNLYAGKLIDFDDSYFSEEPPAERENIVGTPEYYSPELAAYIMDEDDEIKGTTLTLASDVFALGVVFCEYFTGAKPITGTSLPTWSAIVKGNPISFSKPIKPEIETLLRSMLSLRADDRPTIRKVQTELREIKEGHKTEPSKAGVGKESVRLRGKLVSEYFGESKKAATTSIHPVTRPAKTTLRGKGLNNADK